MVLLCLFLPVLRFLALHIDHTVGQHILAHINGKIICGICLYNTLYPVCLHKRDTDFPACDPGRTCGKIYFLCPDLSLGKLCLKIFSESFCITDLSILHSPLGCRYTETIINPSLFSTYFNFRNSDLRCLCLYTQNSCHLYFPPYEPLPSADNRPFSITKINFNR